MISNEDLKAMRDEVRRLREVLIWCANPQTWEVVDETGNPRTCAQRTGTGGLGMISAEKLSELKRRVGTGTIHPDGFCISNINSQDVALLIAEVERLRSIPIHVADGNKDPAHWPWTEQTLGALIDD